MKFLLRRIASGSGVAPAGADASVSVPSPKSRSVDRTRNRSTGIGPPLHSTTDVWIGTVRARRREKSMADERRRLAPLPRDTSCRPRQRCSLPGRGPPRPRSALDRLARSAQDDVGIGRSGRPSSERRLFGVSESMTRCASSIERLAASSTICCRRVSGRARSWYAEVRTSSEDRTLAAALGLVEQLDSSPPAQSPLSRPGSPTIPGGLTRTQMDRCLVHLIEDDHDLDVREVAESGHNLG